MINLLLVGKDKSSPAFLAPCVGLLGECLSESLCSGLRNKLEYGKREIRMKILPWYLCPYPLGSIITEHGE